MKAPTWNEALLAQHRSFIRRDSVREAFDVLVEAALNLPNYLSHPNDVKGPKKDFVYDTPVGGRPFAFIVNREHLLFYVRKEGIRLVAGGLTALQRVAPSAAKNNHGEWTLRIETTNEARRLNALLFGAVDKGGVRRKTDGADLQYRRAAPEFAREVFGAIFSTTPADTRQQWEAFLADSIQYAAARFPDRWVLTLHRSYLRFIVGMVLSVQFHPKHGVTALLLRNTAPRGLKLLGHEYKHAPGCEEALIPFAAGAEIISRIREANRSAIGICAAAHAGNGAFRRAHSPGALRYLEEVLGRRLPDPSYAVGAVDGGAREISELAERGPSMETDGELAAGSASGQGREVDPRVRRAVELRAMDAARVYYEGLGYSVEDTSLYKPYDYVASKGGRSKRVEVKGTQGDCTSVLVTSGEVNAALAGPEPMDLFVLSGIEVTGRDGVISATGGRQIIVDNWKPMKADLVAKVFVYNMPARDE